MWMLILAGLAAVVGLATICKEGHALDWEKDTENSGTFYVGIKVEDPEYRALSLKLLTDFQVEVELAIDLWSIRVYMGWDK